MKSPLFVIIFGLTALMMSCSPVNKNDAPSSLDSRRAFEPDGSQPSSPQSDNHLSNHQEFAQESAPSSLDSRRAFEPDGSQPSSPQSDNHLSNHRSSNREWNLSQGLRPVSKEEREAKVAKTRQDIAQLKSTIDHLNHQITKTEQQLKGVLPANQSKDILEEGLQSLLRKRREFEKEITNLEKRLPLI